MANLAKIVEPKDFAFLVTGFLILVGILFACQLSFSSLPIPPP